jgi:hypothetical protein
MTPRPDDDVSSDLKTAGLSTWRELEKAIKPGKKGQKIDLAKLDPVLLGCFQDDDGHVAIVPVDANGELDMMKLAAWANTRGADSSHSLTTMVLEAIVEPNVRRRS